MSVEKTKLNFLNKGKLDEEQIMIDSVINVADAKKILWVDADAFIENAEPQTNEVNFTGQVFFFVYYIDEDNKIKSTQSNAPFMGKITNSNLLPTSQVFLFCKATEVDLNTSQQGGKISCVVTVSGEYINQEESEILSGGEDNLCVKTEEICSQEMIKAETLLFTEEISYPITDKMENILSVRSKVSLKDIEPGENLFTLSGEIHTTIKYISNSEEMERVMTVNFTEPFRREVEVNGLTSEGKVEVCVCVKQDSFKYELDNEQKKILIEVPIEVKYRAYDELKLPVGIDVFSLTNKINIITGSISKCEIQNEEFFENKFEGSVQLDSNLPRIDKVIGFSNPTLIATFTEKQDDIFRIEGVISFELTYLNDENDFPLNSTKQEVPFKVSINLDDEALQYNLQNCDIVDVDIVARRGREIFIDGKIKSQLSLQKDNIDAVIKDVEINQTEKLPEKKNAIEIYFGKKGDTLWDIAKELKVQPEIIAMQNTDLVLPLEQAENIVIYNHKTR